MSQEMAYLPWRRPQEFAERACIRDENQALTHSEFASRVEAVAEQFAEYGVGPTRVVAVMLPNRIELVVALAAAWRLGAAATPINPTFTTHEADYQIDDAGSVLVVGSDASTPSAGRRLLLADDLRREPSGDLPEATTSPEDVALVIYTSGSTGRPKGVLLTHGNVEAMTSMISERLLLTAEDRCLLFLPLFHSNAIFASVLSPMRVGAQTRLMARFGVDAFFDAVEEFQPTYFSAVPTIYSMLVTQERTTDFSSMRFGVCGAAPVSTELLEATQERFGFGLVEGYGLTEGSCASCLNPVDGVRKLGTVGPALPGQQVAVVAPDGTPVPTGERGEVVIKGPNVMSGYLNRPEETERTIRDGWLHTGDVGILDEDGYLRIVDRIKDLIVRGGESIYPKEIEERLYGHAAVLEAAVIGRRDDLLGEVPIAYVAPKPGMMVTPEDLLAHCSQSLAPYKIPVEIHIRAELPKNAVGKLVKGLLRNETRR